MHFIYFRIWIYIFFILFFTGEVLAIQVRFPKEELAAESVLPVFENNQAATMNRRIISKYKLSVPISVIYRADEPFYQALSLSMAVGFFITESHGVEVSAFYFLPGLSRNGKQLLRVTDSTEPDAAGKNPQYQRLNVALAPHPQFTFFLNYRFTPFYGKFSISKTIASNFHIGLLTGLGMMALDRNVNNDELSEKTGKIKWVPVIQFQLDQKIYFNQRIYFYGLLNFFSYYGPNPINKNLRNQQELGAIKLESTVFFRTLLGGGIGFVVF